MKASRAAGESGHGVEVHCLKGGESVLSADLLGLACMCRVTAGVMELMASFSALLAHCSVISSLQQGAGIRIAPPHGANKSHVQALEAETTGPPCLHVQGLPSQRC